MQARNLQSINKLIFGLFLLILLATLSVNAQSVNVKYFYMPGCSDCAKTEPIMLDAEQNYYTKNEGVSFYWIDVSNPAGLDEWGNYGFTEVPAVVINNETKLQKDDITEENLNYTIDVYLNNKANIANNSFNEYWDVPLAFSMGIFSGFSPCLMAILGFILTYTAGIGKGFKDGMCRAIVFGIGLVTAYILLGICMLVFGKSLLGIGAISIIAGIISILIGLNMLGILKIPISLDDYVKKSAKKYIGSWVSLFFLGILFSMIKVPCATPFLLVLINEMLTITTIGSVILLLSFAVGVLTPFIVIGLIGGYALSERIRSYRVYIKTISGVAIILLGIGIMI